MYHTDQYSNMLQIVYVRANINNLGIMLIIDEMEFEAFTHLILIKITQNLKNLKCTSNLLKMFQNYSRLL